ncbi:hypothetical protein N7540_006710 [Penicillium herquei]|nr:hypothetical protein N7540_006710 [Penicillium herquei]
MCAMLPLTDARFLELYHFETSICKDYKTGFARRNGHARAELRHLVCQLPADLQESLFHDERAEVTTLEPNLRA